MNFFELEGGYIAIAIFFLIITVVVTTRSFMPKNILKKGVIIVGSVFIIFILFHYYMTIQRMKRVSMEFNQGKIILCENKETLVGSQAIIIIKKAGWSLKDGIFSNPKFKRNFHSARCATEYR